VEPKEDFTQEEAYEKSLALLRECISEHGFLASSTQKDNYRRVFSRDSAIIGLAALATDDEELIDASKRSILTLAEFQGEHGEIPSNVDGENEKVSYGGTAGRVDATIWFVIFAIAYYKRTKDRAFLEEVISSMHQAMWLLGAWEFNQKGFIYVPPTGDWADEYLQQGYILYDQLLYYHALRSYAYALEELGEESGKWREKAELLSNLIQSNFGGCTGEDDLYAYHPVLRGSGMDYCKEDRKYWMPFFTPFGYGYRFDAFANVLVSVMGIADELQRELVDQYIRVHANGRRAWLLPAFDPVIDPSNDEWDDLQMSFSFIFKNKPYQYHNGGLWQMITGFYVLDLARRGKRQRAEQYLEGINAANFRGKDGEEWGFYEFLHGKTFEPMGTRHQGWSAAAGVIGYHALHKPDTIIF